MSEAFVLLFRMHEMEYPDSLSLQEMEAFKTHIQSSPTIVDVLGPEFSRWRMGDESTSVDAFIALSRTQVIDIANLVRAFLQQSEATAASLLQAGAAGGGVRLLFPPAPPLPGSNFLWSSRTVVEVTLADGSSLSGVVFGPPIDSGL